MPASRERIAWLIVEGTQFLLKPIVGVQEPAELSDDLLERNERLGVRHWAKLGDRMAVDGDAQALSTFHPSQEVSGVVAQISLGDVRRHTATL